jgi:hypothetical protein
MKFTFLDTVFYGVCVRVIHPKETLTVCVVGLQHLQDILDMNMSALDWMMKSFPAIKEREEMRKIIGRYGLTGQQQVRRCLPSPRYMVDNPFMDNDRGS